MGLNLSSKCLLAFLAAFLAGCAAPEEADEVVPAQEGLFVVVHIPQGLNPLDRGAKYEDPLNDALEALQLGEVSGGGTQLGASNNEGVQQPVAVDLDVDLVDAERGLPALRAELKKLNPPRGTELSYENADGTHVREPLW